MQPFTVTYARQPQLRGLSDLRADIHLPPPGDPADLVVWMHSGGFRTGTRSHRHHPRIAAAFAAHGLATAFIDYRLARPPAVLRPATERMLPPLVAEAVAAGEAMQPTFFGARALAVVEDCCAFLSYADNRKTDLCLSGRYILAGSSAGAISALNATYLPPHLGLTRPAVATVLAYSGGFAYPKFIGHSGVRILAQASPTDHQVPISSIRRFHNRLGDPGSDACLLIEHDDYAHGSLGLTPRETIESAVDRAVAFHRSDRPLDVPVAAPGARVFPSR